VSRHSDEPGGGAGGRPRLRLRAAELLATLRAHDVEFVVIGAFALAPHGYVRATTDLDIVPDPERENLVRLASALRDLEAAVDLGDLDADELDIKPDAEGLGAGGNWGLGTRFGRLDVMQDVPGLRSWRQLRENAVAVNDVLYAGYEELISMKVASGRPEDRRDIGALEAGRLAE
jgi:hypothetical protein